MLTNRLKKKSVEFYHPSTLYHL